MNNFRSIRAFFAVALTAATVAGCSAGGSRFSPAPPVQGQPARGAVSRGGGRSWVAPDAKKKDLLYISDLLGQVVNIYSYPGLHLEGTIAGFFNPEGLCVDKAGDVWVTNDTSQGVHQITEYAHGGTTQIANLNDPNGNVLGCSIDPVTGDLAVTSFFGATGNQGDVSIYPGAKGTPSVHVASNIYYYYYCGYDDQGNLFVDGLDSGSAFGFAELRHGRSAFKNVLLNQHIVYPGGVQWDGKHLAVGDQYGPIYQFDVKGRSGAEVGTTPLTGDNEVVQFWIAGGTVIGPNSYGKNVLLWNYPSGGTPTHMLAATYPTGATVSRAAH